MTSTDLEQPLSRPVPDRIWLLDLGSGDIVWSAERDPDGEQVDAVEYVRTPSNTREDALEEAAGPTLWALCYLHDWDPPREDETQPVYPEVHRLYDTEAEAYAARASKIRPDKYYVRHAHRGAFVNGKDCFKLNPTNPEQIAESANCPDKACPDCADPCSVADLVAKFRRLPLHGDAGCDKLSDDEWCMVAHAALSATTDLARAVEVERLWYLEEHHHPDHLVAQAVAARTDPIHAEKGEG